jgi:ubiquinone/menaquinone biosynthesis C-methylase UbiE
MTAGRVLAVLLFSAAMGMAQHPDHMDHRFDNAAEWARNFDDPSRDAWQMPDKVIAALKLKPLQAVADIGAGTGYFSVRIARSDPSLQVYAVDIEPSMVDYLRSRAAKESLSNITVILAKADSANLPVAVDVALIVDTYHHLPNRVDYFRRLSASLKPGGLLAIIDFKPDASMGPPKEFRFPAGKIRAELAQAGYRQVETLDFLPQQQFLIFSRDTRR